MGYNKLKSTMDVVRERRKIKLFIVSIFVNQVTCDHRYNGTANQFRDNFGISDDRGLMVARGASCQGKDSETQN